MYITILCTRRLSRAQLWDVSTPPGGGEVPWWFWGVIWLVYSTQDSFTHMSGIRTGIARRWGSPGLPSLHRAAEPPRGSPRRWAGLFTGGSGLPEQVFLETEVEGHSLCLISDVPGPHFCCLLPGKRYTKPKFKWMGKSIQVCKPQSVCYCPLKSHWRKRNYTCDLWSDQMHWADFCTSITQLISVSLLSWCLPKSFACTLMLALFLLDFFFKRISLLPFLQIWERGFWHLGPLSRLILEDAESVAFWSYPKKWLLSSFKHAPSFVSSS